MLASKMIKDLQELIAEYGDLPVSTHLWDERAKRDIYYECDVFTDHCILDEEAVFYSEGSGLIKQKETIVVSSSQGG